MTKDFLIIRRTLILCVCLSFLWFCLSIKGRAEDKPENKLEGIVIELMSKSNLDKPYLFESFVIKDDDKWHYFTKTRQFWEHELHYFDKYNLETKFLQKKEGVEFRRIDVGEWGWYGYPIAGTYRGHYAKVTLKNIGYFFITPINSSEKALELITCLPSYWSLIRDREEFLKVSSRHQIIKEPTFYVPKINYVDGDTGYYDIQALMAYRAGETGIFLNHYKIYSNGYIEEISSERLTKGAKVIF